MSGTPDTLPQGTWGIGPLLISWSLKSGNEVSVTASVLGIQVDALSLTLNSKTSQVSDNIDLLGIVTGTIGLEAKYGQATGNGLYVTGQLSGPGFNTGILNHIIIPW